MNWFRKFDISSYQNINHTCIARENCQIKKMGRISEILLNSLFISSAYADNFRVRSCNEDSTVSCNIANELSSMIYGGIWSLTWLIQLLLNQFQLRNRYLNRVTMRHVPYICGTFWPSSIKILIVVTSDHCFDQNRSIGGFLGHMLYIFRISSRSGSSDTNCRP